MGKLIRLIMRSTQQTVSFVSFSTDRDDRHFCLTMASAVIGCVVWEICSWRRSNKGWRLSWTGELEVYAVNIALKGLPWLLVLRLLIHFVELLVSSWALFIHFVTFLRSLLPFCRKLSLLDWNMLFGLFLFIVFIRNFWRLQMQWWVSSSILYILLPSLTLFNFANWSPLYPFDAGSVLQLRGSVLLYIGFGGGG